MSQLMIAEQQYYYKIKPNILTKVCSVGRSHYDALKSWKISLWRRKTSAENPSHPAVYIPSALTMTFRPHSDRSYLACFLIIIYFTTHCFSQCPNILLPVSKIRSAYTRSNDLIWLVKQFVNCLECAAQHLQM
jgi:hypothetical protein